MPNRDPLPPIWSTLENKLTYVQKVSEREFSAECLECGGSPHNDGEWPDRMRIFADEKPLLWCRRCGMIKFPDQFGDGEFKLPSPADIERFRQERIRVEEARKRSAERALEHLRSSRIWEQYHRALNATGRDYWRSRGVPDSLQNYWKLGWVDEYLEHQGDEDYLGQSATIPLFAKDWQPLNIKHRLLHMPDSVRKYKYELRGIPQPLFLTNPELDLTGQVYAVEGEIKAMVTWLTLADRDARIVGLPGATPSAEIIGQFAKADSVTIVLDPGAEEAAYKLAGEIGNKKCKVLIPPMKIDDGILAVNATKRELLGMLKSAICVV